MLLNKNSMFKDEYNSKIKIYVGNTNEKLKNIKEILNNYKKFVKESKHKKLLGLDFEFNNAKIALAQLNLDDYILDDNEVVLVFDPRDPLIKDMFREIVLLENLWVILHGAESLDLPYVINDLLNKKSKDIVRFFQNMIDTRYLCDYTLLESEGRCKINYLLEQQGVITKDFLDNMLKNEKKMGKIYLVHVDVKKLSKELLLYSAYDVIFLPDLIRKLKISTKFIEIIRIVQINYMMKYNLLKEFNKSKDIVSKLNSAYFPQLKENNTLNDIVIPLIEVAQNDELSKFKKINGLRRIIELIEKTYIYPIFLNKSGLIVHTKEKLKPLDLPNEIKHIFSDLQDNIRFMVN